MTAMRWVVMSVALVAVTPSAWAKPMAKAAKSTKGDEAKVEDATEPPTPAPREAKGDVGPPNAPAAPEEVRKQDLSGHDLGTAKPENTFERDRFFVDKTDTEQTAKGTLIQGSLTSTSFGYRERGGTLTPSVIDPAVTDPQPPVPSASPYDRLFTDLRLQTDFRHISAGRWAARIDVRARLVNDPPPSTPNNFMPATNSTVQSGLLGRNELEAKELWLVRNGKRSDVYLGRQFIADLGGVRIDGLRVDYATSERLTLLGFAGLYPIRGSRSVTDDYSQTYAEPDAATGLRAATGRFTGAGGFGAAYRTANAYGSFGGVVIAPFLGETTPRVYATSTGYLRFGSKLDFYHFAIFDAVGSNAVNAGLTNLSLGLNWKPDQRLRGTLNFNRVDTETLNVQAQAFLQDADRAFDYIQNEAYIKRIATSQVRASLSAGLGSLQRVELTAGLAYRRRGDVTLTTQAAATPPTSVALLSAQSVEVYGAITDRRSIAGLRLGIDGSRSFGIGDNAYQRTTSTSVRAVASHEIGQGRGEWELEGAYSHNEDEGAGTTCSIGDLLTCYGASKSDVWSGGGNLFLRISRNWFVLGSLFVNRIAITHVETDTTSSTPTATDPPVVGVSGLLRISYRF